MQPTDDRVRSVFVSLRDTRAVKEDESGPRNRLEALVGEKDQTDEGQDHATADYA